MSAPDDPVDGPGEGPAEPTVPYKHVPYRRGSKSRLFVNLLGAAAVTGAPVIPVSDVPGAGAGTINSP